MCTSQYMVLQIQLMIFNSVSVREEQVYISRSWKGWMNALVQCLGFFHMSYYWLLFNHFVCLLWHSVLSNLKLKFQICGLQPRSGESVLCTGAPGLPRKKWCMVRISENNYALIKKFSIHRPFAPLREKLSVLTKVAQGCHICEGRPY